MTNMKTRTLCFVCALPDRSGWGRLALLSAGMLLLALATGLAHAATYSSASTTASWIDPASHAHVVWTHGAACSSGYDGSSVDDDISAQLPLGFTFNFGGVNYTQVQVMSNGRLQFNNGYCGYGTQTVGPPPTYPYPYPNASVVRSMRVYGTDLDPTPSGAAGACPTASCYVSYATEGTAPNRRFVVTWVNVPEWGRTARTGRFNLQVILTSSVRAAIPPGGRHK
jgi:MSHA biogenesis protein MshQ